MKRTILLAAASAVVITAAAASVAKTMYGTWGVDLAAIDHSVRPGNDFFMYVNGTWYKSAVIPPDRASTGSFQDLRILSENRMKEIAASLDSKPREQLTDEERKLRDLYDGFMDERQIEANGLTPAKKGPRLHRRPENTGRCSYRNGSADAAARWPVWRRHRVQSEKHQ